MLRDLKRLCQLIERDSVTWKVLKSNKNSEKKKTRAGKAVIGQG